MDRELTNLTTQEAIKVISRHSGRVFTRIAGTEMSVRSYRNDLVEVLRDTDYMVELSFFGSDLYVDLYEQGY